VKTLWVKDEYLAEILAGHKTVEVRVGYSNINRLKVGNLLALNDRHQYVIERIGRYADFEELLKHEDADAIAPGVSAAELLARMRAIYPPEKESLGAIALEIHPL
jgi:ASC-1-like (ASCH) protein